MSIKNIIQRGTILIFLSLVKLFDGAIQPYLYYECINL